MTKYRCKTDINQYVLASSSIYFSWQDSDTSQKIETTIVACKKIKYGGWKTGSNYNFEIA